MRLRLLAGSYSVCRCDPGAVIPSWAEAGPFHSITRTADELSIVCPDTAVPIGVRTERGFRLLSVEGPGEASVEKGRAGVSDETGPAGASDDETLGPSADREVPPLDFDLVGILAAILDPLAGAGISIFTLSTFDRDFVLVRDERLQAARQALEAAGHEVIEDAG